MIKAILFDLDGTLLPLDQDVFTKTYIGAFVKKMSPYYAPEAFLGVLMRTLGELTQNDGRLTNEALVTECFVSELGESILRHMDVIDEFYSRDFESVRAVCGCDPNADAAVKAVKELGFRVVLATMPVFPETATRARVRWAGLDWEDFELVTTYENSRTCKPDPNYYLEIANKLGISPEECLMVGNDTLDDMAAEEVGMKVFLLTDNLLNREGKDITRYPRGGFKELLVYINEKMTV